MNEYNELEDIYAGQEGKDTRNKWSMERFYKLKSENTIFQIFISQ
jgi:hypothetical protein